MTNQSREVFESHMRKDMPDFDLTHQAHGAEMGDYAALEKMTR